MSARQLFASRDARIYLVGQGLSLFGDTSLFLATGIWVKEMTHSNADAGLTFFFMVISTLFSPLAGLVVDRVRRRPTLVVVNLMSAGVVSLLWLVRGPHQVWLVYGCMFCYGLLGNFISSAQSAFLTVLLPPELLGNANASLQTVREGLRLVAPLVGAGLFVVVGGHWIATIDAATFVVAATSVALLHTAEVTPTRTTTHFRSEVMGGFRHLAATPILRRTALALALALSVIGFAETAIFAVTAVELHRSASFIGVIMSAQGVGALIGGPLSAPIMRRIGERWIAGLGLVGIAIGSVLFEGGSVASVMAGAVVFGMSLPPILVGAYTLLQLRTPAELQGRTLSAFDLTASMPQMVSIALGAFLIGVLGYTGELSIIAVVVAISALVLLLPVEGEPNFGPTVLVTGSGPIAPVDEGLGGATTIVGPELLG